MRVPGLQRCTRLLTAFGSADAPLPDLCRGALSTLRAAARACVCLFLVLWYSFDPHRLGCPLRSDAIAACAGAAGVTGITGVAGGEEGGDTSGGI